MSNAGVRGRSTPSRHRYRDGFERSPVRAFAFVLFLGLGTVGPSLGVAYASHAALGLGVPSGTDPVIQYVNVSATDSLSFVPNAFTVLPGASVHLAVTQLSSFNHTFTLSSVANATIPSGDSTAQLYAYFRAHPPIVNLTLGTTAGKVFHQNFTAPAVGTYEFVCLVHFADGMTGTMTVSAAAPGPSPAVVVPLVDVGAGAGVAVVAIVAGVLLVRRRRRQPPEPDPFA